jgi:hypothetical protein
MMPVPRRVLVALAVAALLAGACSDGDDGERGSGATTTTTIPEASTSTTATLATSTTHPPVSTTAPAPRTTAAPQTTQAAGGGPLVASAGGWRMVISQPTPGSTIGSVAVLCYEVTGSVREATIAFDVTFVPTGASTGAGPIRVDAAVGRGTARVPSSGISPGRYDVRIQLVLDGARLDGAVVTSAVNVVAGGQTASC